MNEVSGYWRALVSALLLSLVCAPAAAQVTPGAAATGAGRVYHQIEGRVQHRTGGLGNFRVRLLRLPEMRPISETFTRPEGQFMFRDALEGEYVVETFETEKYEAASAQVSVRPLIRDRPSLFTVTVEVPLKAAPERAAPGVLSADIDLNVPKEAAKRYRAGVKALRGENSERAVAELRAAIELYPNYYAARLELGRELRLRKRFEEAEEVLRPLGQIAPRHAEPRIERGIVLLSLKRTEEATEELRSALRLEEASWAAHLYLGWSLLESDGEKAEPHFKRALELNEQQAARAHLALARLADAKGERRLALDHLDAYVALAPDAHDAEAARKLAARLRAPD